MALPTVDLPVEGSLNYLVEISFTRKFEIPQYKERLRQ
jgi:hypothetical protein